MWDLVEEGDFVAYQVKVYLGDANIDSSNEVPVAIVPQPTSGTTVQHTVSPNLLPQTLYSWQVCVQDDQGCWTQSPIWRFTTTGIPAIPVLSRDVMPTILDYLGKKNQLGNVEGESLRPLIEEMKDY